jgi:sugar phosphate isomerase/epimerase
MKPDAVPRIGINSQTIPTATIDEFLTGAGAAGLPLVELAADVITRPVDEIAELARASGTTVLGVCPSAELLDWHWRWDDAIANQLESELARAAELGAEYFVMPFMRPHGTQESVRFGLDRAVPRARAFDMALAVEPIGHFDVLRTARELAPVLDAQDADVVGLLLDSFHFFRAGQHVEDVGAYDDVPILALQLSNLNDVPLGEALGYRDRRFPLDGRMPVTELCARVLADRPRVPLIVEVIGDVAQRTRTPDGLHRARTQLDEIQNALTTLKAGNA